MINNIRSFIERLKFALPKSLVLCLNGLFLLKFSQNITLSRAKCWKILFWTVIEPILFVITFIKNRHEHDKAIRFLLDVVSNMVHIIWMIT